MDEREYGTREEPSTDRHASRGPVGTVLGWSFGPFGAAVGSVVDANRVAFKLSVGTGPWADSDRTDDLDGGTTIEIDDADEVDADPGSRDADSDGR